jgi:hypothetical protein
LLLLLLVVVAGFAAAWLLAVAACFAGLLPLLSLVAVAASLLFVASLVAVAGCCCCCCLPVAVSLLARCLLQLLLPLSCWLVCRFRFAGFGSVVGCSFLLSLSVRPVAGWFVSCRLARSLAGSSGRFARLLVGLLSACRVSSALVRHRLSVRSLVIVGSFARSVCRRRLLARHGCRCRWLARFVVSCHCSSLGRRFASLFCLLRLVAHWLSLLFVCHCCFALPGLLALLLVARRHWLCFVFVVGSLSLLSVSSVIVARQFGFVGLPGFLSVFSLLVIAGLSLGLSLPVSLAGSLARWLARLAVHHCSSHCWLVCHCSSLASLVIAGFRRCQFGLLVSWLSVGSFRSFVIVSSLARHSLGLLVSLGCWFARLLVISSVCHCHWLVIVILVAWLGLSLLGWLVCHCHCRSVVIVAWLSLSFGLVGWFVIVVVARHAGCRCHCCCLLLLSLLLLLLQPAGFAAQRALCAGLSCCRLVVIAARHVSNILLGSSTVLFNNPVVNGCKPPSWWSASAAW